MLSGVGVLWCTLTMCGLAFVGTLLATTADKSYDLHLYSGLDTGAPRHAKVDFGQQMGCVYSSVAISLV